jgi:PelA/Pel-15E family pectate lyase
MANWRLPRALTALLAAMSCLADAAPFAQAGVSWSNVLRQPAAWYGSSEARAVADHVLTHQRAAGGWPKNTDMTRPPDPAVLAASRQTPDSTFDNGATTTEMRFLALVFRATDEPRYRDAILRGLDYLLAAQYPNGGWPQFFPLRHDYSRYITFNDNAMVNVLTVLADIARARAPFDVADPARRAKAAAAVSKGVDVILRTQLVAQGQRTAWCAQYDDVTFAPRGARTYEHASLSGQETVGIVRFLMDVDRESPSRAAADAAIDSAVAWLRSVQIVGQRLERRANAALPSGFDVVVVDDAAAPPLWARFYEIGTNRPIFSGRDGIIRARLSEIEHERRVGYAWLGTWPATLLEQEYPAWRARVGR